MVVIITNTIPPCEARQSREQVKPPEIFLAWGLHGKILYWVNVTVRFANVTTWYANVTVLVAFVTVTIGVRDCHTQNPKRKKPPTATEAVGGRGLLGVGSAAAVSGQSEGPSVRGPTRSAESRWGRSERGGLRRRPRRRPRRGQSKCLPPRDRRTAV